MTMHVEFHSQLASRTVVRNVMNAVVGREFHFRVECVTESVLSNSKCGEIVGSTCDAVVRTTD